ncbi:MAG: hypothetical protein U0M00_05610 [Clostridia bacterium]|nr:hypothetical protein [Clostridia bacterium]
MLKYIWRDKKQLIIIIGIILVCSIAIAIGIYAQVTNSKITKTKGEKIEANYEDLKNNFDTIFTNTVNKEGAINVGNANVNYDELIETKYNVNEKKETKYSIVAKIPLFKKETETTKKINQEIFNTFGGKIVDIITNSNTDTIYNLGYVGYINDNILSLVIKCTLKEGTKAQRTIIQTYNYNIDEDRIVTLDEIMQKRNLDKGKVQNQITQEITKLSKQNASFANQGYNVYVRNPNDDIYKVENTPNFFLGKNKTLYLVYAYGNNDYTSETDLVIF